MTSNTAKIIGSFDIFLNELETKIIKKYPGELYELEIRVASGNCRSEQIAVRVWSATKAQGTCFYRISHEHTIEQMWPIIEGELNES